MNMTYNDAGYFIHKIRREVDELIVQYDNELYKSYKDKRNEFIVEYDNDVLSYLYKIYFNKSINEYVRNVYARIDRIINTYFNIVREGLTDNNYDLRYNDIKSIAITRVNNMYKEESNKVFSNLENFKKNIIENIIPNYMNK